MLHFWTLLSETFNEWLEDKAQRLGAALAYYAAFSIAPLLVLVVAVAGYFYKDDTLHRVQSQIALMAGDNASENPSRVYGRLLRESVKLRAGYVRRCMIMSLDPVEDDRKRLDQRCSRMVADDIGPA